MKHPANEPKRTRALMLRLSPIEHDRLRQAAYERGLKLHDFARHLVRVGAGLVPLHFDAKRPPDAAPLNGFREVTRTNTPFPTREAWEQAILECEDAAVARLGALEDRCEETLLPLVKHVMLAVFFEEEMADRYGVRVEFERDDDAHGQFALTAYVRAPRVH